MGIQESYNRVAGHIQSQSELLAQIKTALAEKAAGGGGPVLVTKTGTTTSTTIDTGLAEIVAVMLKSTKQTVTGIFTASYMAHQDILQFTSASVLSNSKILTTTTIQSAKSSSYISINEGVLTWKSTGSVGFCSGVDYEWYALGYE